MPAMNVLIFMPTKPVYYGCVATQQDADEAVAYAKRVAELLGLEHESTSFEGTDDETFNFRWPQRCFDDVLCDVTDDVITAWRNGVAPEQLVIDLTPGHPMKARNQQ